MLLPQLLNVNGWFFLLVSISHTVRVSVCHSLELLVGWEWNWSSRTQFNTHLRSCLSDLL